MVQGTAFCISQIKSGITIPYFFWLVYVFKNFIFNNNIVEKSDLYIKLEENRKITC